MINDIVVTIRAEMRGFVVGIKNAEKKIGTFNASVVTLGQSFGKVENYFSRFRGGFLSIMFLGMSMERVFMGIARSGVNTFQTVMSSVAGTSTAFTILNAHLQYLYYTVGSALNSVFAALLPILIPIIQWVAQWIQNNPKLAGWLLIIAIVVGFLLIVFGSLGLLVGGIVDLFDGKLLLSLARITGGFLKLGWAIMSGVGKAIWFLITWIGKAAWAIISLLGKAFMWIAANPVVLIIGAIIAVIAALIYLGWKLGGFKEFWESVWNGIKNLFYIWVEWIKKMINDIWKSLTDKLFSFLKVIDWVYKKIKKENLGLAQSFSDLIGGGDLLELNATVGEFDPVKLESFNNRTFKDFLGDIKSEFGMGGTGNTTNMGGLTFNINGNTNPTLVGDEIMKEIKRYSNPIGG